VHVAPHALTSLPTDRWWSPKGLLALLSLLLAMTVWVMGLKESLSRDSVAPALSLQQQEKAVLAAPALPPSLQPLLAGAEPSDQLLQALLEVPLDRLDDRQRLLLAALTRDQAERTAALALPLEKEALEPLQQALASVKLTTSPSATQQPATQQSATQQPATTLSTAHDQLLRDPVLDPLLRQLSCEALGGTRERCTNPEDAVAAVRATQRLLLAELLPIAALLIGAVLLLRHLWMLFRGALPPWPPLLGPLLSPIDMTILVAAGFVLLGEVLLPALVSPVIAVLSLGPTGALGQAIGVLLGYVTLSVPPLAILRIQLSTLADATVPDGGWLQWRLQPWGRAVLQGGRGWLMVMPPVVFTGWLMGRLLGDQGGSNPLLEMVLRSDNPLALLLLALTAVVLAPLFEELVFRGVLLPVLARVLGLGWGVFLSGLVFAVAHLSIGELPPLLVLGIGLALLRLSTGRLLPCVVMHACWNAATFLNLILLGS